MFGWTGVILNVDLTRKKVVAENYSEDLAINFLGGRGFAAKILWDRLKQGANPLSPENILVFATGPLTGFGLPNSGKLVVAAKSPLTGGYGDGNVGTLMAVEMRRAGYDAVIFQGKAEKPVILHVRDKMTEFIDAQDFWGLSTFETEKQLRTMYRRASGIVSIGPAGENLVKFATVVAQEGRAGGRPGMGAVMGSKNLKAIVFDGSQVIPAARPQELKQLGIDAYKQDLASPEYPFWKRQGTMSTVEWSQENSVLPTFNYREGVFDEAEQIGGAAMEKIKVSNRGCPQCNMTCGNVVIDADGKQAELDYENIVMLGSNIGVGDLRQVSALNRIADEMGLDTISLGSALGFAMEASEKGIIKEKIQWGNLEQIKTLIEDITYRRALGTLLAEGVKNASAKIGNGSDGWAMHVKGLEISAYDCHAAPAMALAYGTSSIGAHHKDAWAITWEVQVGRDSYSEEKADKVIELQRLRGGVFETLTLCRFPRLELGLELEWYLKFLYAATGIEFSWERLTQIADRTFNLIRAFWIREFKGNWTREMDIPPARWFDEPLTKGPLKDSKLDKEKYLNLLQAYYRKRGWDERGIPTQQILETFGLSDAANQLAKYKVSGGPQESELKRKGAVEVSPL